MQVCKRLKVALTLFFVLIFSTLIFSIYCIPANATETSIDDGSSYIYYFDNTPFNTGLDNGYSEQNTIQIEDPHYGWTLGSFYLSGYTRVVTEGQEAPVFLKSVGDKVTLNFALEQDIDNLNSSDSCVINDDANGYIQQFSYEQTDFGRGTLFIRKTNYQNKTEDPIVYTDFLSGIELGANTEVELLEEGDYEVALVYEIKNSPRKVLGQSILPDYSDYKVTFNFSVRNGNCMVYPKDVSTGSELANESFTENGFVLDLAKSRYLDIDIKKQVTVDGGNGLTEDTRFNTVAKDGQEFTDEGIYVITVKNHYTGEQTVKNIYVGTDDVLKAHTVTGLSVEQIKQEVAEGATIQADGMLAAKSANDSSTSQDAGSSSTWIVCVVLVVVVVVAAIAILLIRRGKKQKSKQSQLEDIKEAELISVEDVKDGE